MLTTSVSPVDTGVVIPSTRQYNEGDTATLIATPAAEYVFDKWTGAEGTEETTIVMSSDKTVVANFVKKKYALTTAVEGEGTIAEKVIKAGAATDYNSGTVVELTATPSAGWKFKEWSVDLTETENPKEITIDKPKTVTAVFETLIPFYLDENGVTIKAYDWVTAGTTGELAGVTYTAVDKAILKEMLGNEGTDVTKIVTTLIKDDDFSAEGTGATLLLSEYFRKAMGKERFGSNISTWDMSNVTSLAGLFAGTGLESAKKINIDISKWDVSNVTTFKGFTTYSGNIISMGDLSNWDVSKVTNMSGMFSSGRGISDPENKWVFGDLSNWDVSKVTDLSDFFGYNNFDFDITKWKVGNVTNMRRLFSKNTNFNQDISEWDVSKVTTMESMFDGATSFNADITSWDTSSVLEIQSVFKDASSFNQDIGKWDVSKVTNMGSMFYRATSFNQDISGWDISNTTSMNSLFAGASSFNQDISGWNTAAVTNMSGMFGGATSFNVDISGWNIAAVTNMSDMFSGNTVFNQDISGWDVSNVTSMGGMFARATAFTYDISSWNTANVIIMSSMFDKNTTFNQDLNNWDVSSVTNMAAMFNGASSFNGDITSWDTSSVLQMQSMFKDASSFNQDIGNWDVSEVISHYKFWFMFQNATSFNQDLSKWCVTKVFFTPVKDFSTNSALTDANLPVWGTCPSSGSTIWTGATQAFTKSGGSDPTIEANQDRLTSNVWITRGNDGGQIYNVAKEGTSNKTNSPVGTTWAIGTIDQRESLTFKKFRAAVGKPKDVVGKDLVMYLEDDDVYLTVKFTSWTEGKNGGFAYERSTK